MEFDKSKILTVVTAGQAKIGQNGWFADDLYNLERLFKHCTPMTMKTVEPEGFPRRFMTDQNIPFSLFYPAPEPTYAESQAEWIKKNNVKVGTKVRFTKGFNKAEDGSTCCEHRDAKGAEGFVTDIEYECLFVRIPSDCWAVTFTALEVIKEPTYRPFKIGDKVIVDGYDSCIATVIDPCGKEDFMYVDMEHIRTGVKKHSCKLVTYRPYKNAEEFKPFRDKWFVTTFPDGNQSHFKVIDYNNIGIVSVGTYDTDGKAELSFCTYGDMLKWVTRENGDPCGVREEA